MIERSEILSKNTLYNCNFKTIGRGLRRVNIDDLLRNADEDNNSKISVCIPEFNIDLKAPDISPIQDICTDDEYIKILRTKSESLIMEDSALNEYYTGLSSRLDSKKIDEIFAIVKADIPIEPIRRANERASNSIKKINSHLKPKIEKKSEPEFIQESMIEVSEFQSESGETALVLGTDGDIDSLSEKIKNGEIGIETEGENPDQLSLDIDFNDEAEPKTNIVDLKLAFDMIDSDDSDDSSPDEKTNFFSKIFQYKQNTDSSEIENNNEISNEYDGFEYNSEADKSEAQTLLKRALSLSVKKVISAFVLFALIFGIEISAHTDTFISHFISYKRYDIIYVLFQLQIMFVFGAIMRGCIARGIKSFSTGKMNSNTVFTITFIISSLHCVYSIFHSEASSTLYISIPALIGLSLAINSYIKCKKDLYCFSIISSEKVKYVASELSASSQEASKFYSYLIEDSDIYTASKTNFVSSFFKRISQTPKSEDILTAIIPGVLFSSAIIFSVCFFVKNFSIYDSITGTVAFLCTALPLTSVFVISIPLLAANISCRKINSAIIGDCAAEEYSNASVISFEDTEIFPQEKVKLTNIKAYHDTRIDQVVIELARIFSYMGGPLQKLFSDAVGGLFEEHTVIKVIESAENGILLAADGVDYYLGNGDFMRSHSLKYEDDEEDLAYISKGGSVMIFGANDVVAAKLFFKYKPQKGFRKLLSHMYESGLCVGIKTLDPNINNSLLSFYAADSQCPISILKVSDPKEIIATSEKIDSGIVSCKSLGAFLKAFMLCDKARHSIKSNSIVMLTGVILTSLLLLFISFTGDILNFSPIYAFLFQVMWSITILILSFLK